LINYIDAPPFHGIDYYKVEDDSLKAQALLTLMNQDGLRNARMALNKQNNFDRNYKKYLIATNFQTHINQIYQENLRHFLGVN
jgi:hypothetical protein